MSTIVSHSPLSILETVKRHMLGCKVPQIGNDLWGIEMAMWQCTDFTWS